jgi:serine phosphatase RsbU (regulator of sigma subunit)/anti-sigma regulatory factor (Ser/Thr protein kinase)
MCSWRMNCRLEEVRSVAATAKIFLLEQRVSPSDAEACELALVEACNNAVQYTPPENRSLPIEISVFCHAGAVEIHVTDRTNGFDWPTGIALPAPDEEHGRGLFIIQSVMDQVSYLRGHRENRLILRKTRTPASGGRPSAQSLSTPSMDDLSAAELKNRLALSEQAAALMAKELCFRCEALHAIFRCCSDVGKTAAEDFVGNLLGDLLHIVEADWFVLRLSSAEGSELSVRNASRPELEMPPLRLEPEDESNAEAGSIEVRAALARREFVFGVSSSAELSPEDPLARPQFAGHGFVRPICHGKNLLGTLSLGRDATAAGFSPEQTEVIRTFCEFLGIQLVNASLQRRELDLQITARELQIARNIQESLLPKYFPPIPGFGLAGFCLSARQVGGDFYDVFEVAKGRVLLVVADVMGKGIPAALFAATLHTLVRTMSEWTHEPAELLARVNRQMFEELAAVDMFITAQILLLDTDKEELTIANAGHCPVLIAALPGHLISAAPDGVPLGILRRATFREQTIPLRDCASVLLYTDGLTEARNAHGEFFGQPRLERWLQHAPGHGSTAYELSWHFMADLKSFQSQVPLADDQTFLILSREDGMENELGHAFRAETEVKLPRSSVVAQLR